MEKKWRNILIFSLIGNLFIIYVAYKALDYRRHVNYFLDKYTNVVDDFSSRRTFEAENRKVEGQPASPNRVVFIGSQITHGWELEKYFPEYETINRGIVGQRLAGFVLRFQSDVVDLKPAAVVVEFSSYNFRPENSQAELRDYIKSLADMAKANGIIPILTSVVPVGPDFASEIEVPYIVQDSLNLFNRWLSSYCTEKNIPLADFAGAVSDSSGYLAKEYSAGQILLNPAGYDRISRATREVLNRNKIGAK
ncbi:putative GDSL-like Lipase/Acylhydrolase family protein [Candidatus Zixiibacteriota bacterium]|nr:putative GDSL-like Lipase/Acylhydrolase family protein [candidate division Zixibacteria bacterium]